MVGIGKEIHGLAAGRGSLATLQGANAAWTEARLLGQLLLREPESCPILSQLNAKRRVLRGRHGAAAEPLILSGVACVLIVAQR